MREQVAVAQALTVLKEFYARAHKRSLMQNFGKFRTYFDKLSCEDRVARRKEDISSPSEID